MNDRLETMVADLARMSEELADLSLETLHSAAAGEDDVEVASTVERRLTRARRSVEKARQILAEGLESHESPW